MNLKERIHHIVVATNLSDGARRAHAHAAALARALEASVTLLHVDELASSRLAGLSTDDYRKQISRERDARIAQSLEDFEQHQVKVSLKVVEGLPKTAINKWVRANGGDLVVMTKRNRGHLKDLVLGSTTQRVLRLVSAPILVVHEEDPVGDASELPSYDHIMAATDLSDAADRGIRAALSLADVTASRLTLVHVLRMPRMVPLGASGAAASGGMPHQNLQVHRSTTEAQLSKLLREIGDVRAKPLILVDANAGEAISGVAESEQADLITIPTLGRTGLRQILLGSTAERVARIARKPVLVLPRPFLELFGA